MLGLWPVKFLVDRAKLMFLWDVVNKNGICNQILKCQSESSQGRNWLASIISILSSYSLSCDIQDIHRLTKGRWKLVVDTAIARVVFKAFKTECVLKSKISTLYEFLGENVKEWNINVNMLGLLGWGWCDAIVLIRCTLRALPVHQDFLPASEYKHLRLCPLCNRHMDTCVHLFLAVGTTVIPIMINFRSGFSFSVPFFYFDLFLYFVTFSLFTCSH
jgi:hypothetical protein